MRARLILGFLIIASAASAAPPVEYKQEAKAHFKKGVALYEKGEYEAAILEYEIAYAARFYGTTRRLQLTEDARFSGTDLFLAEEGFWPETTVYVTSPGTRLPEPFFLRYGYLEKEEALLVPVGRLGTREYDVWRCAREAR